MLEYIYHALRCFRKAFSRRATWIAFCAVVLGFIGSSQVDGVASLCRFWQLQSPGYLVLLHLFRSKAWNLEGLLECWGEFVLKQNQTVKVQGRAVLLGDHTNVSKDGRRMPGVVTLHQESETQSKPQYFRGHFWGALGLLIGTRLVPFSLPLNLKIHQGFAHLRDNQGSEKDPQTLATRLVEMAVDFSRIHNQPGVLVLDAFFSVAGVFKLANQFWSVQLKQPMVTIITRAKKSYVAYFPAQRPENPGPGRPRQYGDKVKLYELFDYRYMFEKRSCRVYGKMEEIECLVEDLLWRPTGELIRFVFAITSRGKIVLMCSDLTIDPVDAVELYCVRVRQEAMFSMLKHLMHAFSYRFWSKKMPRHSRKPKKNSQLKRPAPSALSNIVRCWESYERFAITTAISLGLLQLTALKFSESIWGQFNSFLRTYSRGIPSERTVKQVISKMLIEDFLNIAPSATMQEIIDHFDTNANGADDDDSNCEKKAV